MVAQQCHSALISPPASLSEIEEAESQLLKALTPVPYDKFHTRLDSGDIINAIAAGPPKFPPMIVIHGWGAGLAMFGAIIEGLSQHYRVYLVDWLGCGGSSRPPFSHTWSAIQAEEFFVKPFQEWIYKVGLHKEPFMLVGHSLGGYLGVEVTLRMPLNVKGLVLVSPVGVGVRDRKKVVKGGWLRYFLFMLIFVLWEMGYTPQIITRLWYVGWRFSEWIIWQRWGTTKDEHTVYHLTKYFHEISRARPSGEKALSTILESGAWARRPLCWRLPKLKRPTVFLYGDRDWMDWQSGENTRKDMSVWTDLKRIPQAGHHIYLDNPDACNEAILEACQQFQNLSEDTPPN